MTDWRVGIRVKHMLRGWTGTVQAVVSQPLIRSLDLKVLVKVDRLGAGSVVQQAYASDLEILPAPATLGNTGCVGAAGALWPTPNIDGDGNFPTAGAVHAHTAPVIPLPPPARRPGLRLVYSAERGRV